MFDLLNGRPLNVILGFLSMICPVVADHASAIATIPIPPFLKHPNLPGLPSTVLLLFFVHFLPGRASFSPGIGRRCVLIQLMNKDG
jgi:hypothetical protein